MTALFVLSASAAILGVACHAEESAPALDSVDVAEETEVLDETAGELQSVDPSHVARGPDGRPDRDNDRLHRERCMSFCQERYFSCVRENRFDRTRDRDRFREHERRCDSRRDECQRDCRRRFR
ncbi:hypothetical protein A7982_12874 [Minicystis rosea]|nr:hypothetical protein A7982_12874 [Minicystis rosea]